MRVAHSRNEGRGNLSNTLNGRQVINLVQQLTQILSSETRLEPLGDESCGTDELLLDAHIDGARYLLIRMPVVTSPLVSLSPREREIARMVAKGYPNKVIADLLDISM